jgi:KUP system potassium uptake protein
METSIQFASEKHPATKSISSQGVGGVVPLRHRSLSRKRTNSIAKIAALEDPEDEDAGLRDERDYKKKQVRKMRDF